MSTRHDYAEETAREIDLAVRNLVSRAYERAVAILEKHRDSVAECAARLLEKETLTGDELPSLD